MSDPISNDYSRVVALSARKNRIAVFEAVLRDDRRGFSRSESKEMLDMLGITDTAWEIKGRTAPTSTPSAGRRDPTGRLRSPRPEPTPESPPTVTTAPAVDLSDPIRPGRHGHNGRCASGLHLWVPQNIRSIEANGRLKCRPCEQSRKQGQSTAVPRDPEAPVVCKCPGLPKHLLTPVTSDSTYVDPRGQRHCRVGIDRRREAEKKARDARTGKAA